MSAPAAHLTVDDVARRWQCSCRYVWTLKASGRLPYLALGRLIRFRVCDIEAFEAERLDGALR